MFTFFTVAVLQAGSASAGATLTVNDSTSGNICNGTLSLQEAVLLGRNGTLGRNLTTAERNQVGGVSFFVSPDLPTCPDAVWAPLPNSQIGPNFADDIFFTNSVGQINDRFTLGKNDDINGLKPNSSIVVLDGTGQPAGGDGIFFQQGSGSQVRNLVIRNYPRNGIFAQQMNGAIFEGLHIYNNGANGMSFGHNGTLNSRNVRIGGTEPQHRNLIYSNAGDGIVINSLPNLDRFPGQGITILNNYIGTQNGTSDNGNGENGINPDYALENFRLKTEC